MAGKGKAPAFQFYPNDWSRDLEEHPLEIEGAWIRLCCKLWWSETRGELTRSEEQWAKILRTDLDNSRRILKYINDQKIGNVIFNGNGKMNEIQCDSCVTGNAVVTVMSRRMIRDEKTRKQTKLRVQRHRDKTLCNGDVTDDVTQMKHRSSSSSSCTKVHNSICPQSEIVDLFKVVIPEALKPKDWGPERQVLLRARWNEEEKRQDLEWWKNLFLYIRKCPFLMGEVDPAAGHRRFFITLPWLVKKSNLLKVIEGNYERS